jgi:O-antigen ligase
LEESDYKTRFFTGAGWIITPLALIFIAYNESIVLDPALLPKFLTISLFLLVFGIFILYKNIQSAGRIGAANNGIMVGLMLYVFAGAVSLYHSSNVADGLFDWLKMVLLLSFTWLLTFYFQNNKGYFYKFTICISIFALIISLTGVYQLSEIAISGHLDHQGTYLIKSTFANRNLFAEVLLLTIPFSIFGMISLKGIIRIISAFSTVVSTILMVTLLVREVWVAIFFSIIATSVIYLIINRGQLRKSITIIPAKILWTSGSTIVMLLFVVVLLYGRSGSIEQFKKQTSFISNPYYGSSKDRFDLWVRSFKIIKSHPLAGTGIGTWKIEQLQYNEHGTLAEDAVTFYQSPHNDFIWVTSEMGIPGLICYLFIFAMAFYYLVVLLKRLRGKPESVFYYFLFFGLVSYFVISNFGFPRERIEQQVLLAMFLAAIGIGYHQFVINDHGQKTGKAGNGVHWSVLISMNLLLLTAIIYGSFRLISETHIRNAFEARAAGNEKKVIREMNEAESFARHLDPLSTPLSWYSGSAYFILGDKDSALNKFASAYGFNPYHVHVLNNYGSALELHARHTEAIAMYKQALKINPDFDDAWINLTAVYYNTGQIDSACFALRKVNPQCPTPRYQQTIDVIVPVVLSVIESRTSEVFLKKEILRIRNGRQWRNDIFFRAIKNNISIQYQCILDIFYVMDQNNPLCSAKEVDAIKAKYKNSIL